MNGFPSCSVTRWLRAEAEAWQSPAPRPSQRGGALESLWLDPLRHPAPDGSPAEFGGQARGLGGEEVWDWNRHVLVTQGCEVPSLRLEDDPTEFPFYLSSVRTFWTMKPGRSSSTPPGGRASGFVARGPLARPLARPLGVCAPRPR